MRAKKSGEENSSVPFTVWCVSFHISFQILPPVAHISYAHLSFGFMISTRYGFNRTCTFFVVKGYFFACTERYIHDKWVGPLRRHPCAERSSFPICVIFCCWRSQRKPSGPFSNIWQAGCWELAMLYGIQPRRLFSKVKPYNANTSGKGSQCHFLVREEWEQVGVGKRPTHGKKEIESGRSPQRSRNFQL